MRFWVPLVVAVGLFGCPVPEAEKVRFGVDSAFVETGLAEAIRIAYEQETKKPLLIVPGLSVEIEGKARAGQIDVALLASDRVLDRLEAAGLALDPVVLGYEEFIWIGPPEDKVRAHGFMDSPRLLQNLSRFNTRLIKGPKGSVEAERYETWWTETKDFQASSGFKHASVDGMGLVERLVARKSWGFVRRSAIVMAKQKKGVEPHRIYHWGWPDLLIKIHVARIHDQKTKRNRAKPLMDFLTSDKGKEVIETFGAAQYGIPFYQAGAPKPGEGAGVPGIDKEAIEKFMKDQESAKTSTAASQDG